MKTKSMLIVTLMLLGIGLAACAPSELTIPPVTVNVPPVSIAPQPPQRTITVSGSGKVILTPDIAYINIGVHTQDASASAALADNTLKSQAVIDAIKAAGVDAKDIQTTNFSIYPQQVYDPQGVITGVIYQVDNTVSVTVRDLGKLGTMLDATVQAGANSINSISFDVADKSAALSQARAAAVADARQQAEQLATASGVTLGDVQTISYYDSSAPITVQYARAEMAASGAVPIQSGSMDVSTTVTIVFDLK